MDVWDGWMCGLDGWVGRMDGMGWMAGRLIDGWVRWFGGWMHVGSVGTMGWWVEWSSGWDALAGWMDRWFGRMGNLD